MLFIFFEVLSVIEMTHATENESFSMLAAGLIWFNDHRLTSWCIVQCFNVALESELSSNEAATLSWCVTTTVGSGVISATMHMTVKTMSWQNQHPLKPLTSRLHIRLAVCMQMQGS